MIRHTITGLVIDCIEAITEHCQFSFPVFMRLYTWKYSMSTPKAKKIPTKSSLIGGYLYYAVFSV